MLLVLLLFVLNVGEAAFDYFTEYVFFNIKDIGKFLNGVWKVSKNWYEELKWNDDYH